MQTILVSAIGLTSCIAIFASGNLTNLLLGAAAGSGLATYTYFKRRWWRFIRVQSVQESIPQFVLKLLLTSFIYLRLSIFQRHHAQHRVFPELRPAVQGSGAAQREDAASARMAYT